MAQIQLLYDDGIVPKFGNGVLDLRSVAGPIPIPPIPPNPIPVPPTPGTGEVYFPNQSHMSGGVLTYPKSGQTRPNSSGFGGAATLVAYTTIPNDVTVMPTRLGFFKWAEYPGNAACFRSIQIEVNGVIVMPFQGPGDYGIAPALNFTIGNPDPYSVGAFLNFNSGDNLKVLLRNPNGEMSDVLWDVADPAR